MGQRDKQNGMALVSVLFLLALLPLLATATVSRLVLALRTTENMRSWAQATHAADAGWLLCTRWLEQGRAPSRIWLGPGEPAYWRSPNAFEGSQQAAFNLTSSWPNAVRPPQCLVERWERPEQPDFVVYLVTVRGFGPTLDAQAWMQSITVFENAMWRHRWRSVAGQPLADELEQDF